MSPGCLVFIIIAWMVAIAYAFYKRARPQIGSGTGEDRRAAPRDQRARRRPPMPDGEPARREEGPPPRIEEAPGSAGGEPSHMLQRPPAEEPPGVPVYQREAAESGAGAPELEPASAPAEAHTPEPADERPPGDDVSIDSLLKGMDGPVLDDGVNINDLLEDMGKPSV